MVRRRHPDNFKFNSRHNIQHYISTEVTIGIRNSLTHAVNNHNLETVVKSKPIAEYNQRVGWTQSRQRKSSILRVLKINCK